MKFSHSWLLKYLKTTATPTEIAVHLTNLGIEVDSVKDPSAKLKGFVYAKVVTREKHPNADRLSLCMVDAGTGELVQVVCGAPNVKADMGVAFASVGTVIPATGEALKKGKIRDVESFGMLCSARELELGEDSDGIMDLGLEHKPGTSLTNILKTDAIYDVSITPNRGDCFSVYGIARDLAVIGVGELQPFPNVKIAESDGATPNVEIKTNSCSKFTLRKITGVKNPASSQLMQDFLVSAGQKPITALVDITNYMCVGLGRPMHVFDADKVKGNLVVREAVQGEKLQALNDNEYTLDAGMVVVADDNGVIAIGGIMGGKSTCVDENTQNVLLEAALFDKVSIATTGQKLNLISDSRMRFERGVDAEIVEYCSDLATYIIIENCGGKAYRKITVFNNDEYVSNSIKFYVSLIQKRLGLKISEKEATEILTKLGCKLEKQNDFYMVTPPSWRHDLEITEDLVEEIARIKGYQHIEAKSLPLKEANVSDKLSLQKHMIGRGFLETINWSFIDSASAKKFIKGSDSLLELANPISEDLSTMRPSLIASLLKVAAKNVVGARYNGALFELAPVYSKEYKELQTLMIAGLRFGSNHAKQWQVAQKDVDVFDVKNDVLSVLAALNISENSVQLYAEGPDYYHPGRKGCYKQGQKVIAYFGEVHPAISVDFKAVGFEIFLENIPNLKPKKVQKTFSNLMPVKRDFAFVLDAKIAAQVLIKSIEKAIPMIEAVEVFDCYQGVNVEQGKKSLAVSVILQPTDKTLSDVELLEIHNAIVASAEKVGAVLRG
jgi:phenylalanyl-tRNA synthetase beta chain